MLKIIEARGDNFACGLEYGAAARRHIVWRLDNFVEDDEFTESMPDLHAAHDTLRKIFPQYLRELEGIAEGARVDFWRLFYFNTPEIADRESGCTSIAVRTDDEAYLLHNEDSVGEERSMDCVLLHFALPTATFHAFAYGGELAGACYGWNSHGLFFSVNYLPPIAADMEGRISRTFVTRHLVEAASIDDAVGRLQSGGNASGYHHFIGQGDRIVSVEQCLDEVRVAEVNGIEAHSNHYLHPRFARQGTAERHSRLRYQRARKLLDQQLDPLQVLADRSNAPLSICTREDEELHTVSTVRFLPRENRVELYEPETLRLEMDFPLVTEPAGAEEALPATTNAAP
jgi:hypothetical protein